MTQHIEMFRCDRCSKKWKVAWAAGNGAAHSLTCDCGRVLKTVQVAEGHPPLMVLQHAHGKTLLACLPAIAGGAFYPVLPDAALLLAYVLSWALSIATFAHEHNRSASALAGIALWSLALVSAAAGVGALAGHYLWWR